MNMDGNFEEDLKKSLQNNDQAHAAEITQKQLKKIEEYPLNIAITGESGSGKSTFVNALRGLKDGDHQAAPTGVVETTMEATSYEHPQNPKMKIWDLPGIGTPNFEAKEYLKRVEFDKYDFFIIVSDNRFRENDAKLAQEIQNMKKKFYFVRSKIDNNMRDEKRRLGDGFDEKTTLNVIKENCIKELNQRGIKSPQVFLISSVELHLYDFGDLWKTLEKELPDHQRNALLLVLPNISLEVIQAKKKVLKSEIKWHALASGGAAAVPIPGTSLCADIAIIVTFVIRCQKYLGLSGESLLRLSTTTGVPMEELKAEIKSPLAGVKISTPLVMSVLRGSISLMAAIAIEEGSRFIPILGIPIAMSLSFGSTYQALKYLLNTLSDDAQRVFEKAMGLPQDKTKKKK